MKLIVANILLLLFSNVLIAQNQVKTYTWEQAKLLGADTVYSITFEKTKLDSLPEDLMKFVNLKKLDLSKNDMSKLPSFISSLTKLEILNLGKNKFITFPAEICKLTSLKQLILNRNDIAYIPDCIDQLTQLEYLDIWDTPVATFPESIVALKNLKKIDARGVMHGPKYQTKWREKLSWVKIEFDSPCNCFE